jgi:hypothetical protein
MSKTGSMTDKSPDRRAASRNAGAFLGPYGTFPADLHTLSDEMPPEPSEADVERRGRHAYRPPRSLLERFMEWIRGTSG